MTSVLDAPTALQRVTPRRTAVGLVAGGLGLGMTQLLGFNMTESLVLAVAIIDAAALSFLGLGNPDQRQPEWGQMLGDAQKLIGQAPHLAFYPAACIIVVALGFTLMGESLREALDPKSRR